jgi:hypothetical protein
MKKMKTSIILLIIIHLGYSSYSQSYDVTIENIPYEPLTNFQEIDAYNADFEWPVFQIPIGFEFPFFDISSEIIYSNPNSFGGYTSLNNDEDNLYMLVHFLANFIERGDFQDTILSPIRYITEGGTPNRIFTLEYNDMGFFFGQTDASGIYLDYINIQIRLYENSGNIEFHIGPYIMNEDPDEVFDVFSGPFVGIMSMVQNNIGGSLGEVVSISGDINDPIISNNPFVFMDWPIPENTVFKFSNLSTSNNNIDNSNKTLKIFPNPVNDRVTIKTTLSINQIRIYNTVGQQVFSTTNKQFNINHLNQGIYNLVVYLDGTKQSYKLIKL